MPFQCHSNTSLMTGLTLRRNYNFEMKMAAKDILYSATCTGITGYKFAKIKFTIYGNLY